MMGRTHVAIGTATAMGACALTTPELADSAILVAAAVGSSKLPDQLEVFGLRHRGPTHWLLTALVVTAAVVLGTTMVDETHPYALWVSEGFTIGYLMHIAADCCTVSGVPVFGPFSKRDRWLLPRGMRFVTGKAGDSLLAAGATMASVGLAVLLMP